MITDIAIRESLNGGDAILQGKDLAVSGIENMVYLSMFCGDGNWWGNDILMPNQQDIQFRCETEQVLKNVPLTSSGRGRIEEAVKNDLAFLQQAFSGTAIAVSVAITGPERVDISISIDGQLIAFQWSADTQLLNNITTLQ